MSFTADCSCSSPKVVLVELVCCGRDECVERGGAFPRECSQRPKRERERLGVSCGPRAFCNGAVTLLNDRDLSRIDLHSFAGPPKVYVRALLFRMRRYRIFEVGGIEKKKR